jgi:hypothetical protein
MADAPLIEIPLPDMPNLDVFVDHSKMKLGVKAVKTDSRTLQLADYTSGLPPAPPARDWMNGVTAWGMMLNDKIGLCTIAAAAHAVQVWSLNTGKEITVADDVVLSYYEQWDGYNPNDPSTDRGGVELDVLSDWQKSSFADHKLIAYADPEVGDLDSVRQAINLFGGVYIGISLPVTAQRQVIWDAVPKGGANAEAGSWGGHAVFVAAYDETSFTCITWGMPKKMTIAFWNQYVVEAHALLSQDWISEKGSPGGFQLADLQADLGLIHKQA